MLKKFMPAMLLFLVVLGGILACAANIETFVWKDKEYKGGVIDSILIIGLTKNTENRTLFENTFAEAFQKEGVKAYAGVNVFGPDQPLTENGIRQKALDLGVKAVILTHLFSVTEEDVYQSTVPITNYNLYRGPMGNYYAQVNLIDFPGYNKKQKFVRLRTNLYEAASENLILSISSKSMDPKSVEDLIQSVSMAFIKDLKKNDLL